MDESSEPTLPPMPSISASTSIHTQHSRPKRPSLNTRKRTHSTLRSSSLPPSASSDPALFSGDDESTANADNYIPEMKRKKKLYSGSWWSHRVKAGREERKREFKRNVDSGVFMMNGDDSEDVDLPSSDSLGSLEGELIRDLEIKDKEVSFPWQRMKDSERGNHPHAASNVTGWQGWKQQAVATQTSRVHQLITQHLESGNENVELSSMGLTELPPEIADLATLTTEPNLVPGMLDTGRPFEANLQLMLCNNNFREFPTPILNLSNLKILSLRQSGLRTIPANIVQLTSLVSLNVAGNKLKYLPFELLELATLHKLKGLHARPNPWMELPVNDADLYTTRSDKPRDLGTRSLTENVLRQLYRISARNDLKTFMPEDTPAAVCTALDNLAATQREGGRLCTICKRAFVTQGEEWFELWPISHPNAAQVILYSATKEDFIPFKRVACQVGCANGVTPEGIPGLEDFEREWTRGF